MKTQNTSGFVAITGIIISIGRLTLGTVENLPDDVILIVMALVNYVALICIAISL